MGFLTESDEFTFGEYADKWKKQYADVKCKPSTARRYKSLLGVHILPRFKSPAISKLTRDKVKAFFADFSGKERLGNKRSGDEAKLKKLAANSLQNALVCLRVVLNCALEDTVNPASRMRRILVKDQDEFEAVFLPRDEAKLFLASTKEICSEHYTLFLTLLRTGMRRGEALALRWGDIQFGQSEDDSNRFIWQRNFTGGKLTTPKNRKSRRVDLSGQLRKTLSQLREERLLKAFMDVKTSIADELVFPSESGTFIDPGNLYARYFLPAVEHSALRRFRIHDLRYVR